MHGTISAWSPVMSCQVTPFLSSTQAYMGLKGYSPRSMRTMLPGSSAANSRVVSSALVELTRRLTASFGRKVSSALTSVIA